MPIPAAAAAAQFALKHPGVRRAVIGGAKKVFDKNVQGQMAQTAGKYAARYTPPGGQEILKKAIHGYRTEQRGRPMPRSMARGGQRGRPMPRSMARGGNPYNHKRTLPYMAKGGKVRKTGLVYLHKGERVVPTKKVKKVENGLRKMGINLRLPKSNTTVKVPVKMLSTTQLRNLAHIGGKVMKTGPHKVSKGQRVIPASKVKSVDKILRKK